MELGELTGDVVMFMFVTTDSAPQGGLSPAIDWSLVITASLAHTGPSSCQQPDTPDSALF